MSFPTDMGCDFQVKGLGQCFLHDVARWRKHVQHVNCAQHNGGGDGGVFDLRLHFSVSLGLGLKFGLNEPRLEARSAVST